MLSRVQQSSEITDTEARNFGSAKDEMHYRSLVFYDCHVYAIKELLRRRSCTRSAVVSDTSMIASSSDASTSAPNSSSIGLPTPRPRVSGTKNAVHSNAATQNPPYITYVTQPMLDSRGGVIAAMTI